MNNKFSLLKSHIYCAVLSLFMTFCTSSTVFAQSPTAITAGNERRLVREGIEWCDVWIPNLKSDNLPRVLLIGDSITRGYYGEVEKRLTGKAFVGRLATSRSVSDPALIKEINAVLSETKFDVIHFNNGLHGWGYTEEEYKTYFPELLEAIHKNAPSAKLIWATITPLRAADDLDAFSDRNERVKVRNGIARNYVEKLGIPVDDLFSLVEKHPEYYLSDGTHYNEKGVAAQAEQVAAIIADVLAPKQ